MVPQAEKPAESTEPEQTDVDAPQETVASAPEPHAALYYLRDDLFTGDLSGDDVNEALGDNWSVPWARAAW